MDATQSQGNEQSSEDSIITLDEVFTAAEANDNCEDAGTETVDVTEQEHDNGATDGDGNLSHEDESNDNEPHSGEQGENVSAEHADASGDENEANVESENGESQDKADVEDDDDDSEADFDDADDEDDVDDEEEDDDETGFAGLGLSEELLDAVTKIGWEKPSAIQESTIPFLIQGRDVVGLAQTGTGKTAAFALPILEKIDPSIKAPQALVLAPTRELALQDADAFQALADHLGAVHVLPIYGGQSYGVQLSGLRRGAQIIVGTPGRVIDHLQRGSLDISGLRYLVLDEADEMLNMGFQDDVETILDKTPEHKQVALFSATMPDSIRRLSKRYLNNPEEITVKSTTKTATNITQRYLYVAHYNKLDALTRILEITEFDAMIMFVRTKHETEELAEKLRARGFSAAAINGDMVQNQRERTVEQLRDGRLDILVATDVAARGLDVDRISHVVNYDIPNDTESYVHRIGRTGRAGRNGEAILFVTPRERRMLRSIERVTRAHLEEMDLPTVDEVNQSRTAKFKQQITDSLEDPQVGVFRKLVKSYSEEYDTPVEDIAAALAAQLQSGDFFMKDEPKRGRRDRDNQRRGDRFESRDRNDRGGRRGDRGDRGDRFERSENMDVYTLHVGRRQNVRPGSIVGALANEGGLTNRDFGRITINVDRTFVELPKNLDPSVLDKLKDTRISGQLINMEHTPDVDVSRRDDDDRGGRRGGFNGRDRRDDRGVGGGRGGRDRRDDRRDDRGFGGGRGGRDRRDDRGFSDRRDDRGFGGGRGGRDNDRDGGFGSRSSRFRRGGWKD